MTVFDPSGISKVWIKIWDGVVGVSNVIYEGFMSLIAGVWTISIEINASFPIGNVNFTIYANDTRGQETNQSDNFTLFAYPGINFTDPTPLDGITVYTDSAEINISIVETGDSLDELIYNWNGTNYTIYDNSLVAFKLF